MIDAAILSIIGGVGLSFLYDKLKGALGLTGYPALILAAVLSAVWGLVAGLVTGQIVLDAVNWANLSVLVTIVYGTAEATYKQLVQYT